VALKSDDPVMLDGMRFEDVQNEFAVPVYAFDFESLAVALESGLDDAGREAVANALARQSAVNTRPHLLPFDDERK